LISWLSSARIFRASAGTSILEFSFAASIWL
jgi:hypothetical protein